MVIHAAGRELVRFTDMEMLTIPNGNGGNGNGNNGHKHKRPHGGRHNKTRYVHPNCPVISRWLAACEKENGPCRECKEEHCCVKEYDQHQEENSRLRCALTLIRLIDRKPR